MKMMALTAARVPHAMANTAWRALSSKATPATLDKADVSKYARQRKVYTEQVNDLRKQWAQHFQQRNEEVKQQKLVEKVHIHLRQAEKLREKRRITALRAEETQRMREQQQQRWREHVAKQQLQWAASQEHKQQTYQNLVSALDEESKVWINEANLDAQLSPEFFGEKVATTGLFTRHSDHMRYTLHVTNAKRPTEDVENSFTSEDMQFKSFTEKLEGLSITDKLEALAGEYMAQRQQVSLFLEDIIDNGRDREHFHQVTQTLVDVMQQGAINPGASLLDDDEEEDEDEDEEGGDMMWRDKGYYDEDVEVGVGKKDRMQASKRLNARLLRQEAQRVETVEEDLELPSDSETDLKK